jgi:hypothetical protein
VYKSLCCWRSNWVCQAIYWVLYNLKWISLIRQATHSNTDNTAYCDWGNITSGK